ncbi:manganese transport system membrane protein MntD [Virgibacillus pantothenticus]|uniref:Iron ABC transporter n=1 Tax=Virgibacillus pantothenticus TaxID=1473 RepID=A0A0L0QRZ8_VIRPA|nr:MULTISPECIES: metal ABC transporter permease [Virgibacillus]API92039.1 iron ABC transporter [Virgibacillus sp. 6R]KNE21342.1 iron ABC transporter [Virgibacillus pantothenticus]MBS7430505.1 metal ABC transporter permease [Virgibacillus sp. 19R1-5]MBU8566444.1 metal ABC transporter permease [Virgibacillus pantothenticus]MBU8600141.1 metal ABC transporter permease [Virgibacillus pantothenticus]
MTYTFWILLTGCLVGVTCGITGAILVLRKMAMIADAISHTVLLGIVGAFFVTQSLDGVPMLIGAGIVGILTAIFVEMLNSSGVQSDAAIGIVFTSLFALGVVLISFIGDQVHLDVQHALMGEIAFVPWNTLTINGVNLGPTAVWMLGAVLVINLILITLFYKEIKMSTFDPQFATLIGVPVVMIHYLLMTMVSLSTVASFDSVGAILVVAMLIVPGATAYLLTDRFLVLLILSGGIGILSAALGYLFAVQLNVSIAGSMAVASGVLFLGALLFSPNQGIITKKFRRTTGEKAVHSTM